MEKQEEVRSSSKSSGGFPTIPVGKTTRQTASKKSNKSRSMPGNSLSMTPEMLRRLAAKRLGK